MKKKEYIQIGVNKLKEDLYSEWDKLTLKKSFFIRFFTNEEEEKKKRELYLKYLEYGFIAGFLDGENYKMKEILKTLKEQRYK
jgi:hypothetical protein